MSYNKSEVNYVEHDEKGSPAITSADQTLQNAGVNSRLLLLNLFGCIGGFTYGFSAAIVASSLGQPNLFTYFDLASKPNVTEIIGAIASLFNVGGFFGLFAAANISDIWGRKWGYLFSVLSSLLGAALAAGSTTLVMLIMGRFFTGMGAYCFTLTSICYQQEMSPTRSRGAFGSSVGVALMVGYVTAGWIGYGFYWLDSISNWRIPLALQVVSPLLLGLCLPFVPESPRWLESKGRCDEALRVLKTVHKYHHDPEYIIAREEYYQIKTQTALEKTMPCSWISMAGRYRRRSLSAILVIAANQFTGSNLLANFGPRLYASLGYSASQSLIFQAGWLMLGTALALFTALIVDRVGRLRLLVWSVCASAVCIAIEAALSARIEITTDAGLVPSKAIQSAAVAMLFIWYLGYAFGEPIQYLYIGEIFPNHIRIKGTTLGLITHTLMSIWTNMAQPTGQAKIGWKFWLIFICCAFVLGVLQYFVLPETRNVPLEEVGGLFGDETDVAVHAADIYIDSTGEVTAKR